MTDARSGQVGGDHQWPRGSEALNATTFERRRSEIQGKFCLSSGGTKLLLVRASASPVFRLIFSDHAVVLEGLF